MTDKQKFPWPAPIAQKDNVDGSHGPVHATRDTGVHPNSGPGSVRYEFPSIIAGRECTENAKASAMERRFEDIIKESQVAKVGGRKFDGGKPQYGLMPVHALEENVKVLTVGAQKYEPDNWKRVPDGKRRYFDAALRHLWAFKRGEDRDPETGLHHLAHALCCIEFILDLELSPTPENPREDRKIFSVDLDKTSATEAMADLMRMIGEKGNPKNGTN